MTHDELLAKVKDEFFFTQGFGSVLHLNACYGSPCHCDEIDKTHLKLKNAMLAVVELHRNIDGACWECQDDIYHEYPCPTIRAIEKELSE